MCRRPLLGGERLGHACDFVLGLDQGITARGLEGGFLDFHSALRAALVDPTVIDRWYGLASVTSTAPWRSRAWDLAREQLRHGRLLVVEASRIARC